MANRTPRDPRERVSAEQDNILLRSTKGPANDEALNTGEADIPTATPFQTNVTSQRPVSLVGWSLAVVAGLVLWLALFKLIFAF